MKKYIIIYIVLVLLMSCQRNEYYSTSDLPINLKNPVIDPLSMNMNSESVSPEAKITWKLTSVYSSINNEESAYIKMNGSQAVIYPFAWDKYPNIDGDPTEGEVGFAIPLNNYQAVWLDDANFTNGNEVEIFLKLISQEGYQVAYVYYNDGKKAEQIFSIESLGEVSLKADRFNNKDATIHNEDYSNEKQTLTIYGYNKVTGKIEQQSQSSKELPRSVNIEAGRIQQLTVTDQEKLLSGPWIPATGQYDPAQPILYFNADGRQIIFGKNDMLEISNWPKSTKVYNGLYLSMINSQIDNISNNLHVLFENRNEINLNFTGDSVWRGKYRRMSASEKAISLPRMNSVVINDNKFSGLYKSASGEEYFFDYPLFTMTKDGTRYQGRYSHYNIHDQAILQLHFTNSLNLVSERKSYLIELNEHKEGNRLVRLMNLAAGELVVWGFEAFNSGNIYLEQIEFGNS